jgi:hypothetical protein
VVKETIGVPIATRDGRLASAQTQPYLSQVNVRREQRKQKGDKMAAVLLLYWCKDLLFACRPLLDAARVSKSPTTRLSFLTACPLARVEDFTA